MNKYSEKSDFEINLAVAHIVLGAVSYDWNSDVKLVKRYVSDDCGPYMDFNPCNNPEDAMPIVIDNKITVAYDYRNCVWVAYFTSEASAYSNNYYRAAMEVFLMMKEVE